MWDEILRKINAAEVTLSLNKFPIVLFILGPNSTWAASQVAPTVGVYPQESLQEV